MRSPFHKRKTAERKKKSAHLFGFALFCTFSFLVFCDLPKHLGKNRIQNKNKSEKPLSLFYGSEQHIQARSKAFLRLTQSKSASSHRPLNICPFEKGH